MIYFLIFPNCNLDTDDYDVTDPENSTKGIAPLSGIFPTSYHRSLSSPVRLHTAGPSPFESVIFTTF